MITGEAVSITILGGGITPLEPVHRTGWRLLPFHVFVYNRNVRGRVQQMGADYIVQSGEAYLTRQNVRHYNNWIDGENPVSVWCHFNAALFHTVDLFDFYDIPLKFTGVLAKKLEQTCEKMLCCPDATISGIVQKEALAHELVSLLVSGCTEKPESAEKLAAVNRLTPALDYMRKHLSADFDLAQAAKQVCLSPSRFAAVFKSSFGISPGACWRDLRMAHAYEILCRESITVKEASGLLGFYDEFHFAKEFRKKYGITPAALIRKIKLQGHW